MYPITDARPVSIMLVNFICTIIAWVHIDDLHTAIKSNQLNCIPEIPGCEELQKSIDKVNDKLKAQAWPLMLLASLISLTAVALMGVATWKQGVGLMKGATATFAVGTIWWLAATAHAGSELTSSTVSPSDIDAFNSSMANMFMSFFGVLMCVFMIRQGPDGGVSGTTAVTAKPTDTDEQV
ncbi:MAG: hypothetical protein MHM6MM_003786 [Cercozoa sp. M6MM]